jgi:hypothetical protein
MLSIGVMITFFFPQAKGRRLFAPSTVLTILLALCFAASAHAAWPDRPITLIVPFAPGGPTDIIARILATSLHMSLGQPVIIDNRAGAAGNTGMGVAAHATPDGYTLLRSVSRLRADLGTRQCSQCPDRQVEFEHQDVGRSGRAGQGGPQ